MIYDDGTEHDVSAGYLVPDLPATGYDHDPHETSFMTFAACRDHDPRIWETNTAKGKTALTGYVIVGGERRKKLEVITEAREICRACPVESECLKYVSKHPQQEGVWAALLPEERASERQQNVTP